ncbi:TioE family transcriptional regulator [Nocardia sp. NPDC057353]|uniref:TioE family transcriptional regulator n=1 Tax=Nocardia sp. NPDC057353 TaxID=3346104 RepID=UPI003642BAD5
MTSLRPSHLAREHGISTQAVRNYERDGFLPPAARTPTGYRIYTERHAAALRAYLALVAAHGHDPAGRVMTALHAGEVDRALAVIADGHGRFLRDRDTLDQVRRAIGHLTAHREHPEVSGVRSIGELAHRLRLSPATLRTWERAGILVPARDRATGHRIFRAGDVRDAELAHLLRRGGYPLERIATVVEQVRTAGGTDELAAALDGWQQALTARGLAMLRAAARLDDYLRPGISPETWDR